MSDRCAREVLALILANTNYELRGKVDSVQNSDSSAIVKMLGQAADSARITVTAIYTMDGEVAQTALQFGAEVMSGLVDTNEDPASVQSDVKNCLLELQNRLDFEPDLVVLLLRSWLPPTSEDIDRAVDTMMETGADSLILVAPFRGFLWKEADKGAKAVFDKDSSPPSLEYDPGLYLETGGMYIFKPWVVAQCGSPVGGKSALYVMDDQRALSAFPAENHGPVLSFPDQIVPNRTVSLEGIRMLALDFDGVMTDDKVLVLEDGREAVACNRADGLGISRLVRRGFPVIVISKERNPVVTARCKKLQIPCFQAVDDKVGFLILHCQESGISPVQVAYVGNDINDLECMQAVGVAVAVANAHAAILAKADIVLETAGGQGAVREICDMILKAAEGLSGTRSIE